MTTELTQAVVDKLQEQSSDDDDSSNQANEIVSESPLDIKLSLFAGAGIGLLFGMLMGASVTPTVATMLGTLTAILTAILGVNDNYFNKTKAARIGAFGFACFIGAYISMFIRAHNLMSPSIITLKNQYIEAGFNEEQALAFIAQQRLGATLSNSSVAEDLSTAEASASQELPAQAADDEIQPEQQVSQEQATQTAAPAPTTSNSTCLNMKICNYRNNQKT